MYYPTMVLFVDDNRAFLDNLSLQLPVDLAFRHHERPSQALLALNDTQSGLSLAEQIFVTSNNVDIFQPSQPVIDIRLDRVLAELQNPGRFERISVVVVDYDMPEMDGLTFCRQIRNPAIKRILLTGQADEKLAVRAFNAGLIDRFILKHDPDVMPTLNQAIMDLQHMYFDKLSRMVVEALPPNNFPYLRDPLFAAEFQRLCQQFNIIEFYLTAAPQGFLILDAAGLCRQLIIKTADALQSHYEIAEDQQAPDTLLAQLASREFIPLFATEHGEYMPECGNGEAHLLPATAIQGRECYYYTIVNRPSLQPLSGTGSYHAFLEWFDQQNECRSHHASPA